jgi:hypothetical protein
MRAVSSRAPVGGLRQGGALHFGPSHLPHRELDDLVRQPSRQTAEGEKKKTPEGGGVESRAVRFDSLREFLAIAAQQFEKGNSVARWANLAHFIGVNCGDRD